MGNALIRAAASLAVVSILGCSHPESRSADASMCAFHRDSTGIMSDGDYHRAGIDTERYQYVRDLIVGNSNYQLARNAIERASRGAVRWVSAVSGIPEESNFEIVHVALFEASCEVRYVVARSGDRVDFDIEEGVGELIGCSIPHYIARPDLAALSVRNNPNISISHERVRFLVWDANGRTCGSVVDGQANLSWWGELVDLAFLVRG